MIFWNTDLQQFCCDSGCSIPLCIKSEDFLYGVHTAASMSISVVLIYSPPFHTCESWWNCLAFSNLFIIQYVSQRVTQQTDRNSTNTFGFKKVREHQLIHTHSKPLLSLHLYEENPISLCILTLFSKLDCKKRILHKQSDSSFFCKITTANGPIFMKGPNVLHEFL